MKRKNAPVHWIRLRTAGIEGLDLLLLLEAPVADARSQEEIMRYERRRCDPTITQRIGEQ